MHKTKFLKLFSIILLISNIQLNAQKKPKNSFGFSLITALYQNDNLDISSTPYNPATSTKFGNELGLDYNINFSKFSINTGLRFGLFRRRINFSIPDGYVSGTLNNSKYLDFEQFTYLALPLTIEKKWYGKKGFYFGNIGTVLRLPTLSTGITKTSIVAQSSSGNKDIITTQENREENKIKVHFTATLGKGFMLGKKNEGKIGLMANIATNPFMKGTVTQFKQPNQDAVVGTYTTNGNFVGLLLNFTINRIQR